MHTTTLRSPWIGNRLAPDTSRHGRVGIAKAPTPAGRQDDRLRSWACVLVALIAFFTGYVLALSSDQPSTGSRVGWPVPPVNPRSLSP